MELRTTTWLGKSLPSSSLWRTIRKPNSRCQTVQAFNEREARPENIPGPLAVDHTCIDCDTCRWMQPEIYGRVNGKSAVVKQPKTAEERFRAAQALLACPTHSIHLSQREDGELTAAANSFPDPIPGTDNVFHCGFHSASSFGAASYFLRRPEGNIMMDCPRFNPTLAKRIKAMGGAKYMVLSHKDDVADHAKWAEALGLKRIIHVEEVTRSQGTTACEIKLEGKGPWSVPEGEDVEIIFTPGHTEGHISLMYRSESNPQENACFTGDHLAFSRDSRLSIMKGYNWYSVDKQLESVMRIKDLPFLHLLPGHGRPGSFRDSADRDTHFDQLLAFENYDSKRLAGVA